jgi:hypothetical protein
MTCAWALLKPCSSSQAASSSGRIAGGSHDDHSYYKFSLSAREADAAMDAEQERRGIEQSKGVDDGGSASRRARSVSVRTRVSSRSRPAATSRVMRPDGLAALRPSDLTVVRPRTSLPLLDTLLPPHLTSPLQNTPFGAVMLTSTSCNRPSCSLYNWFYPTGGPIRNMPSLVNNWFYPTEAFWNKPQVSNRPSRYAVFS